MFKGRRVVYVLDHPLPLFNKSFVSRMSLYQNKEQTFWSPSLVVLEDVVR